METIVIIFRVALETIIMVARALGIIIIMVVCRIILARALYIAIPRVRIIQISVVGIKRPSV